MMEKQEREETSVLKILFWIVWGKTGQGIANKMS